MVGSLSKSCGWVWEEVISSKERKEAAVFRTKYVERNGVCPIRRFMPVYAEG